MEQTFSLASDQSQLRQNCLDLASRLFPAGASAAELIIAARKLEEYVTGLKAAPDART